MHSVCLSTPLSTIKQLQFSTDLGVHGGIRVPFVFVSADHEFAVRSLSHGIVEQPADRVRPERVGRGPVIVAVFRPMAVSRKYANARGEKQNC